MDFTRANAALLRCRAGMQFDFLPLHAGKGGCYSLNGEGIERLFCKPAKLIDLPVKLNALIAHGLTAR